MHISILRNRNNSSHHATKPTTAYQQQQQQSQSQQRSSSSLSSATMTLSSTSATSSSAATKPKQNKPKATGRVWKTAVDPKTGRTYYYDAITRETQWRKPLELATDEERKLMARKEKKQKDFFASMEANIMKNLAAGSYMPPKPTTAETEEERDNVADLAIPSTTMAKVKKAGSALISPLKPSSSNSSATTGSSSTCPATAAAGNGAGGNKKGVAKPTLAKPQMVRTISSMDDNVLAELTRVERSDAADNKCLQRRVSPTSVVLAKGENGIFDESRSPESMAYSQFIPVGSSDSEEEEDQAIEEIRRVAQSMAELTVDPQTNALPGRASSEGAPKPAVLSKAKLLKGGKPGLAKPNLRKRNTCGTMYVGSTMSAPDKDATIKCICGVYRAHLLQSAMEPAPPVKFDEYEIFNDMQGDAISPKSPLRPKSTAISPSSAHNMYGSSASFDFNDSYSPSSTSSDASSGNNRPENEPFPSLYHDSVAEVPSLEEITNFYREVFRKSQMESDCIIMSLIYVERLIKETNGGVRPRIRNWRSILFSSMILSSKVWDDLSMWNADFSQCVSCPPGVSFSVQRINLLERAMLNCLNYIVKVAASEYAKYYFLLRSMLIRSGLGDKEDLNTLSPLDVEGARQLELRSSSSSLLGSVEGSPSAPSPTLTGRGSPRGALTPPQSIKPSRRVKSLGDAGLGIPSELEDRNSPEGALCTSSGARISPGGTALTLHLEQVVQM